MKAQFVLIGVVTILFAGCTRVVVNKDPGPHDKGFRYYRPKPYLFIGPTPQAAPKNSDTASTKEAPGSASGGQEKKTTTVTTNNLIQVSMSIKYLPDYNEEYSIKLRPGMGVGSLNFELEDGWNLTSVGMETDQKIPEMIESVASLVGAVGGIAGGSSGANNKMLDNNEISIVVDTRPDVPLGFYEPIISQDPTGRKSLFGWRYVGFMPFTGCPVDVCAPRQTITCDLSDLWGIVATPSTIKFQRLSDIQAGISNPQSNPYREVNGNGEIVPDKPVAPPLNQTSFGYPVQTTPVNDGVNDQTNPSQATPTSGNASLLDLPMPDSNSPFRARAAK